MNTVRSSGDFGRRGKTGNRPRLLFVVLMVVSTLCTAVLLVACARGGRRVPPGFNQGAANPDPYDTALQQAMIRQHLSRAQSGNLGYQIGPEDIVEVRVFGYDKFDTVARVGANGYINLPLLGGIRAEGLTERQLEAVLQDRLRGRYIRDPNVTVFLRETHAGEIAIVGAVEHPGRYVLLGEKRLVDLLTEAGGMTDKAGSVAYVIRFAKTSRNPSNPHPAEGSSRTADIDTPTTATNIKSQTIVIDLDRLLLQGDAQCNIALMPGDLVNVPDAGSVHITGPGIKKPGTYSLTRSSKTLTQIVDEAEGLTFQASNRIFIIRRGEDSRESFISVKYKDILRGAREDVVLRRGDQVITQQTPVKGALASVGRFLERIIRFGLYGSFSIPIGA